MICCWRVSAVCSRSFWASGLGFRVKGLGCCVSSRNTAGMLGLVACVSLFRHQVCVRVHTGSLPLPFSRSPFLPLSLSPSLSPPTLWETHGDRYSLSLSLPPTPPSPSLLIPSIPPCLPLALTLSLPPSALSRCWSALSSACLPCLLGLSFWLDAAACVYETSPLPRGRCVCVCVRLRVRLQTYACIHVHVYKHMHFHTHTRARSLLTPPTPFSRRTWTATQRGCYTTSGKSQRTGAPNPNRTRRRRHYLRLR
jgi:hypothetical protein